MVRAKFRVTAIKSTVGYNTAQKELSHVTLNPVTDDANKSWSKWTPTGQLEMQINNPAALEQFKLGQCYFLDFTEAPATEAEETAQGAVV